MFQLLERLQHLDLVLPRMPPTFAEFLLLHRSHFINSLTYVGDLVTVQNQSPHISVITHNVSFISNFAYFFIFVNFQSINFHSVFLLVVYSTLLSI